MKEIVLTKGYIALVDNEYYEYLSQWKWYANKTKEGNCYAVRTKYGNSGRSAVLMHRLILGINDPKIFCDHIDGNGLNNQRSNLRPATNSQNQMNRRPKTNGTSRYLGVHWCKISSKWKATIVIGGKVKYIGLFEDENKAAVAYNELAMIHHKEFARPNIVY